MINRKRGKDDEIRLSLPVRLYTEAMPDNPSRQAIFYGPVLLAGVLGEKEPDPVSGVPVFVTDRRNVSDRCICTYRGMDNRGTNFEIQAAGKTIADEDLNRYKASKFYDISDIIPEALTKGKQSVNIKFMPKPQNSARPLYGSRMIRE